MMYRQLLIALILCSGFFAHAQNAVGFQGYRVPVKFQGKPATPLHNTPNSKTFRTKIREAVADGPNFADHYTLAIWGCGSSCAMFSIVDAVNGKVYDFPATVSWIEEVDFGITFHRDSRAVRVVGYLNEKGCSTDRWYSWDGTKLSEVAEKPSEHAETHDPAVGCLGG
jgi:hypothetical protein